MVDKRLKLITPSILYMNSFDKMVKDYNSVNENFRKDNILEFGSYIKTCEQYSRGENLKPGYVASTEYWLVDVDMNIIGTSDLRHSLTESLKLIGGNIGYSISPSFRKKGYGKLILKLSIEKARLLGLEKVLVTTNEDNIASEKIIIANGGVYEGSSYVDEEKKVVKIYWINIDL